MLAFHALKYLHIIGASVLLGTGAGIAFFMLLAQRANDPVVIAGVARIVVIADYVFTASAAILQPITGALLVWWVGYSPLEGWILLSLLLYVVTGAFWIPVVFMQRRLRDLAIAAAEANEPLPPEYHAIFRRWFAFGFPAFASVLAIFWLMIARPPIALP